MKYELKTMNRDIIRKGMKVRVKDYWHDWVIEGEVDETSREETGVAFHMKGIIETDVEGDGWVYYSKACDGETVEILGGQGDFLACFALGVQDGPSGSSTALAVDEDLKLKVYAGVSEACEQIKQAQNPFTKGDNMNRVTAMLKRVLSKDMQKLYKAGLLTDEMQLSNRGVAVLTGLMFEQHKAELVKEAEQLIADEESKGN